MFAMGDRVVYPLHGGAIIKDIEAHIHEGDFLESALSVVYAEDKKRQCC